MTELTTDDDAIGDLPPSGKYIVYVLEAEGPLTRSELLDETRLPERTLDEAIVRLREADVVACQYLARDARSRQYRLR